MEKDKVYFAHSKRIYNTKEESTMLDFLRKNFTKVICPNKDIGELGSIEPYLKIVDTCKYVVAHEYQGSIGKGVFSEIKNALSKNIPVLALRKGTIGYKLCKVKNIEINDSTDWAIHYGKIIGDNNEK